MSFFATLVLGFFLGDVLWAIFTWRRLPTRAGRIAAMVWCAAMMAGLGIILFARGTGEAWDTAMPRPVLSVIFLWHLLVLPPWLTWTLARSLALGARKLSRLEQKEPAPVSRREFLTTAVTFAPAVLVSGGAALGEWQLEQFRVRRLAVPVTGLPPALDGLTIAHVTDVHIGRFTRSAVLERIVRTTNDLNADLVLLTGDLINFALRDLPAGVDLVRGLRGQHGVFLCEGNHDLIENGAEFRRQMLRFDLPFLRGDAAELTVRGARVQVLGLPWVHGNQANTHAIATLDEIRRDDAFLILLAHHPHAFDLAEKYPLTLAGHTHGGQLMLNEHIGFGPWFFRYWSGLYQREGRSLVVSNGVGNWFPIRTAAPAEIVHLTLRRA